MANEATLGILITADDHASPVMKSMASGIESNRMALRSLAMGVSFLGMSFMSMGMMMKQSDDALTKSTGNTLMMVGAMMTAVSTSIQFIKAIGEITKAIRVLTAAEILANAFSIKGIMTLAVGGALAAGTIAGINKMNQADKTVTVNIKNQAVSSEVAAAVRKQNIKVNQMTAGAGMMP